MSPFTTRWGYGGRIPGLNPRAGVLTEALQSKIEVRAVVRNSNVSKQYKITRDWSQH